jgi:glutathione S-transferase/RNA polymerase-associated protein
LARSLTEAAAGQTQGFFAWLAGQLGERTWFNGDAFGWADLCVAPHLATSITFGNSPAEGSPLAGWFARAQERPAVASAMEEARAAFGAGSSNIADLLARGVFKREYRDHRLEWMIKSGGLSVVLDGLEAGNIRFTAGFG